MANPITRDVSAQNTGEGELFAQIDRIASVFGMSFSAWQRLVDQCWSIRGTLPPPLEQFAIQAHVDAVIHEQARPHLAVLLVELDGRTHRSQQQQRRDALKNEIVARLRVPMWRIKPSSLHRDSRGYSRFERKLAMFLLRARTR